MSPSLPWAPGLGSERDLATPPNIAQLRSQFATQRAELERRLAVREASYAPVGDAVSCDGGTAISDPRSDLRDYQMPAPPSPTPQVQYADLTNAKIAAGSKSICMQWEMAGDIHLPTMFTLDLYAKDKGFDAFQYFKVDVRSDRRARIVGGLDADRHEYTLPGRFGISGNAATLVVDEETFAAARAHAPNIQFRPVFPLGAESFKFAADVQVRLSPRRLLYDGLGTEPVGRFDYPSGRPCADPC